MYSLSRITDKPGVKSTFTMHGTRITLPFRARIISEWTARAAEAIEQLKTMGLIELKRPLSFWKEALAKLMAMPLAVDIPDPGEPRPRRSSMPEEYDPLEEAAERELDRDIEIAAELEHQRQHEQAGSEATRP
nr:hypothetical protein [Candidatus Sigynarchaeum springense]